MKKVSIIIPVYNAEEMLRECLNSVINQTYSCWEAICVDDGSPDSCPQILDEYAAKDSRIKVVHKSNEGVSVARNLAMDMAEGEYLLFVDSDDIIHPQLLEICVYQAEKFGSDMVTFKLNKALRKNRKLRHFLGLPPKKTAKFKKYKVEKVASYTTDRLYDYVTEHIHLIHKKGIKHRWIIKHCHPVKCLFKTEVIRDVKFIPDIRFEDIPWWGEMLKHIKQVTINNLPLYYYYPSCSSFIVNTASIEKMKMRQRAIDESEKIYAGPEFEGDYRRQVWEERFVAVYKANVELKKKYFASQLEAEAKQSKK